MSDVAIRVDHLSKQYRIGTLQEPYGMLRDTLVAAAKAPLRKLRRQGRAEPSEFWALRDVSFEVKHGEVLGVIGRNGAGKSTLLKILSRITEPTAGRAEIRGRVGSLLEVGTGFHPELTGRENIYLNGAILGMTRRDIARRFAEIVEFAGIEKFLDMPVKRYSSGMYTRLAFSVAAHLEPEVLIVDEVLSVGDAAFQKKSLGKMDEVAREGRTVLFVSHNMATIESLCQVGMLLMHGQAEAVGPIGQIVDRYLAMLEDVTESSTLATRIDRKGNGRIRLTGFYILDALGRPCSSLRSGGEYVLCFPYVAPERQPVSHVHVGFTVYDGRHNALFRVSTRSAGADFTEIASDGVFRCAFPRLPLASGTYTLGLYCEVAGEVADWVKDAASFVIEAGDFWGAGTAESGSHGAFLVDHEWTWVADTDLPANR